MVPIYNLIMTEQDKTDLQSVERLRKKEGRKQEALSTSGDILTEPKLGAGMVAAWL